MDRRDPPRALEAQILEGFFSPVVLDGEIFEPGLTHPEPLYDSLYRYFPLHD